MIPKDPLNSSAGLILFFLVHDDTTYMLRSVGHVPGLRHLDT